MKKLTSTLLSVALASAMIMVSVPAPIIAAPTMQTTVGQTSIKHEKRASVNGGTISLNEEKSIKYTGKEDGMYFTFTAPQDGIYSFSTSGKYSTYMELRGSTGTIDSDHSLENYDTLNYPYSSKEVYEDLEQGQTYVLQVFSDEEDAFYFKLKAAKVAVTTGISSDNLSWKIDGTTLTISGNGAMYNFGYQYDKTTKKELYYQVPWHDPDESISHVVIEEGVTNIGDFAFSDYSDLEDITLPSTLKTIGGNYALSDSIEKVYYQGTQNDWYKISIDPENVCYKNPSVVCSNGTHAFYSGVCGDHLTWKIENNSLTISGTGDMYNYSLTKKAPWESAYFADHVSSIKLNSGITSIGNYAFYNMDTYKDEVSYLKIPSGVITIGSNAFRNSGLTDFALPGSLQRIGKQAFYQTYLDSVSYAGSKKSLSEISVGASNSPIRNMDIECSNGGGDLTTNTTIKADITKTITSDDSDLIYRFKPTSSGVYFFDFTYFGADDTQTTISLSNGTTDDEIGYAVRKEGGKKTFRITPSKKLVAGVTYELVLGFDEREDDFVNDDIGYTVLVSKKRSIDISKYASKTYLSYTSTTFSDTYKKPMVTISGLKEYQDYSVSYSNNFNAGQAKVTITGKNDYTGTITKYFTIKKATPNFNVYAEDSVITARKSTKLVVTGNKTGTIGYKYDTNLVKISNKTVQGLRTGTAVITVTSGSNKNYNSVKRTVTVKIKPTTTQLNLLSSKKSGQITASWTANKTTDYYELQYATTSNFSNAKTITMKSRTAASKTITGLKKGQRYYVRIRSLDRTKTLTSSWSSAKSIMTKK